MSFDQFILRQQYQNVRGLGDRLELMKQQIDWQSFIPLVRQLYRDDKKSGGRPHTDELVVVRSMLLQVWYNLSDEELEFQCHDRLSFRNFLGFPESIPDFSTIWKARERLREHGADAEIWQELQRQLTKKGYKVKQGVIQDASFVEADLGRKRHHREKQAKKKGEEISYTDKQKQHMDHDGSFSIKHGQLHYGYKAHIKLDVDYHLIRSYHMSTASLHDGEVELVRSGDNVAYRDKGYVGKRLPPRVRDKTMRRATKKRKLNGGEQKRNRLIARKRAPGERPFVVIKRVFHGTLTRVKTLERVQTKEMWKCFAYNLYQLVTLKRKALAAALS